MRPFAKPRVETQEAPDGNSSRRCRYDEKMGSPNCTIVQFLTSPLRLGIGRHLDKAESEGFSGQRVHDHSGFHDIPILKKQTSQFPIVEGFRQVFDQ